MASQQGAIALSRLHYLFAGSELPEDQSGLMPKPARIEQRPAAELIAEPEELRRALSRSFLSVSRQRTLVIAIDDADPIDEKSAGVLTALLDRAPRHALLIALTAPSLPTADSPALTLLARRCEQHNLLPLTEAGTRELFGSVFCDVANFAQVASEIQRSPMAIRGGQSSWPSICSITRVAAGRCRVSARRKTCPRARKLRSKLAAPRSTPPRARSPSCKAIALALSSVAAFSSLAFSSDFASLPSFRR
ncbi:MAG TPA: hypothetical protein VFN67_19595 [Polyangiales bacterium]|nr:hypothetical protein [Polyangiales bacterium]